MIVHSTKQQVVGAASSLFYQNGFHGTSVRDIANKAGVNVSLISYYFKSKQGLLEHAITQYYEAYLDTIERAQSESDNLPPLEKLKHIIYTIIEYKQQYYQLSCFIQRELSLHSMFVREMAVTYVAKENYMISHLFYNILPQANSNDLENKYLLLQLKGMLITPYLTQYEWKNQVIGSFSHKQFVHHYARSINKWLDFIVEQHMHIS